MTKKPARTAKKAGTEADKPVDVLVAGAGYVGLAIAAAVAEAAPHLSIRVVDPAPEGVWKNDARASAIAAAACRMLEKLGCWDAVAPDAEPIREMIVTDSRTGDPVRPVFLTFDGDVGDGEPFAHMMPNATLNGALREKCAAIGVTVSQGAGVANFTRTDGGGFVDATMSDGTNIRTRLLIAADGARSALRTVAGIKTVHWDYGQSGIVATIAHERPHNGRAEEHFLPSGPFAILPLKGNRSSIVWSENRQRAEQLLAGDDFTFDIELEKRFGLRLGEFRIEGQKRAYPLGLTLARDFVRPRFALAGDAAHGIHPIAGQGLNLGFKDAAAIAETIVEADRLGQDIGALDVLQRYERWRRFDTLQMGITCDVLNRTFSNDFTPLRAARDIGLGMVDRMPGLKNFFISQAAGLTGPAPRLLRGEAI
ncbi:ubiquinone biosynthesis hydroxylase [Oricola sp.]|uniref:ubiquinone biosynthesis hydroxylase n=1 Tax=Oricola sp. TaxID=1979950 RepID=UPI003BAA6AE5